MVAEEAVYGAERGRLGRLRLGLWEELELLGDFFWGFIGGEWAKLSVRWSKERTSPLPQLPLDSPAPIVATKRYNTGFLGLYIYDILVCVTCKMFTIFLLFFFKFIDISTFCL